MKKSFVILIAILILLALAALGVLLLNKNSVSTLNSNEAITVIGGADGPTSVLIANKTGGEDTVEYTQITMDEAKQIFDFGNDGSYVILDVRRADEYASGHIPGAVNVANELIGAEEIAELPDKNQAIYVHCRSGRRSKEAAAKLVVLGYTNIIEFGGIIDWTGEIEQE